MNREARGLALAQLLFALFLASVVLLVTARLFRGYAEVTEHFERKDREYEMARHVLHRMAGEISESYTVTIAADQVTLTKKDPTVAVPPASFDSSYDPQADAITVTYRLDSSDNRLLRQTSEGDRVLAEEVSGFSVTQTGRRFDLRLTLTNGPHVSIWETSAYQWTEL